MNATSGRPVPPAPECSPALVGPCRSCQHPTHRYGMGGSPLCILCRQALEEQRASKGNTVGGRP